MKNFIKGRWFPLSVAVAAVLVIAFTLFFCGFRITYAPALESSWDAVSGVASWAGVIIAIAGVVASFLAVWFAIQIPKKIAEQQNKIALFEKRHEVFDIYNSCKVFSELLQFAQNKKDVQAIFLLTFCNIPIGEEIDNPSFFLRKEFIIILEKLRKAQFLFHDDVSKYIKTMAKLLLHVVNVSVEKTESNEINGAIEEFTKIMNTKTYQTVLETMGNDLKLK